MKYYVVLDTNVFKSLGRNFHVSADYKELVRFLFKTDGEMLVSEIVCEEFLNHFKKDVEEIKKNYNRSVTLMVKLSEFAIPKKEFVDVNAALEKIVIDFRDRMFDNPHSRNKFEKINATAFDGLKLTKFINEEKAQDKKEPQVKDLLIYDSILNHIQKKRRGKNSKYTFIGKDKGFKKNENFQMLNSMYPAIKLEFADSISEYLKIRGHNLPYVNNKFFSKEFTANRLYEEIDAFKDIILEQTTVLKNYYKYDLILKEIKGFELAGYYSYKDNGKYKYVLDVRARVKVTFRTRSNGTGFGLGFGTGFGKRGVGFSPTYSHAIFNGTVYINYAGLLDNNRQKIKSSLINSFQAAPLTTLEIVEEEVSNILAQK